MLTTGLNITEVVQIRRGNRDILEMMFLNPTALRKARTLWSFGLSECSRVNVL